MGRQPKTKKAWSFGNGKVTPIQIAFIVDRYLADNGYSGTRSVFRTEASSLIAKSPIQEAPKRLLSLGDMLDEYLCLKEQKVLLDHERIRLEQEKSRVQSLLHGMQNVMNVYNASGSSSLVTNPPVPSKPVEMIHQSAETPNVRPASTPASNDVVPQNFASPVSSDQISKKRKVSTMVADAPPVVKRSRTRFPTQKLPMKDTIPHRQSEKPVDGQQAIVPNRIKPLPSSFAHQQMVHGSSVVKCLFNQPPTNSPGPFTPPRANSQKSLSPPEISSVAICSNSTQLISPTRCTVISSKSVTISPFKQIACYTVESSHCISSSSPVKANLKPGKRDQIKGRLDFDGSDEYRSSDTNRLIDEVPTSILEKDKDIYDIELPNLDVFGEDFSFTDMLEDLDLDCDVLGHYCNSNFDGSAETSSGSPNESMDNIAEVNQVMSEFSSTFTQVLSEEETNVQGLESLTAVKSITKCLTILSPAKNSQNSPDQKELPLRKMTAL